ncbi:HAD family hydrolase [Melioribacteraceae bacterium 4301-Me]|uniref:HAD family hydrolase n=1 Tax=Pyranulibacter aquaticus TaxID=3163344 RepID=UPI003597DE13
MKINCVVFDLDGTLVSSHLTIYDTTVATMKKLGIRGDLPKEEFYSRLGHHFIDIFREFNIEIPDFEKFISIYKSLYFGFINTSSLYPGVTETLTRLKKNKVKTALLTTKGQDQAEKISAYFKIDKYLDYIMGRRDGIANKPSPEPLEIILNELGVQKSQSLMVGDTELDIQCGKNAGIWTCAVTFGYRKAKELINERPDFVIDNFEKIFNIVMENKG